MQSLNFSNYLQYAIYIIRTNSIILWFIALIGLISSINTIFPENPFHGPLIFLSIITAIFATPVIYGFYFEIIEDKYSSVVGITRKYVLNYTWLLLKMYLPVILIAALPIMANPEKITPGYFQIIIICFSLIYIYIIPIYYVTGVQRGSITTGIYFLSRTFIGSAPIILIALVTEAALILFELKKGWLLQSNKLLYAMAEVFVYMAANIIDFTLFIVMIYILKSHLTAHDVKTNNDQEK